MSPDQEEDWGSGRGLGGGLDGKIASDIGL